MKRFLTISIIMIAAGFIVAMATFGESMLYLKNEKICLNTAEQSEFDEKKLVEGEIDFVYGPFATYEETTKKYGVTVSKKETNFYVVGNFTNDMFMGDEEYEPFYAIFSTSDKDLIKDLNSAADKWVDWLTSDDLDELPPEISIDFEGKLWTDLTDKDYVKYRDEAFEDLGNIDIERSDITEYRIVEGKVGASTVVFTAVSILVCIGGVIILIVGISKNVKKKKQDAAFDAKFNEIE